VDTSLDLSLDTPALRFINGDNKKVPLPPSVAECALQLEAVANSLKKRNSLHYLIGNNPVDHALHLKEVLLQYPEHSSWSLMGGLLAGGRARLFGRHVYREEPDYEFRFRRLDIYLGYSHNIAFWAWVDYPKGAPTEGDVIEGGSLDAQYLEELFNRWDKDEPGRILNGLLKAVKVRLDDEAAAKRSIADNLDLDGDVLQEMTAQLDKMLPPVEVDEDQFDWWPAP
jgi:hypothetical protein